MLRRNRYIKKSVLVMTFICVGIATQHGTAASDDILDFLPAILSGLTGREPQPEADSVFIRSTYIQTNSFGHVNIYGEIFNNTDNKITDVDVSLPIIEDDGSFFRVLEVEAPLRIVPPRSKTCFNISSPYSEEELASLRFDMPRYFTTDDPIPDVTVIDVVEGVSSVSGRRFLNLSGQLKNDSGTALNFITIVVTAYGANGGILYCGDTFFDASAIEPGNTHDFSFLTSADVDEVESFVVQAQGSEFISPR